jgi:hypothetical protein
MFMIEVQVSNLKILHLDLKKFAKSVIMKEDTASTFYTMRFIPSYVMLIK